MPVRFRFCGDAEVPDWILASIHEISNEKPGELRRLVRNVVDAILEENDENIENDERIKFSVVATPAEEGHVAAINFILRNAISNEVTEVTLSNELQQIGFTPDHAVCFCQVYTQNIADLKSKAEKRSFRCSVPKSIHCEQKDVDFVIALKAWQAKSRMNESYKFILTEEQAQSLISELNAVLERTEAII